MTVQLEITSELVAEIQYQRFNHLVPIVQRRMETLLQATPEIWNSDQGIRFASPRYLERLQNENIKISMDGRG